MDELKEIECIVCGHIEDIYTDAKYCVNCGAEVINYCTNDYCELNNGQNKSQFAPYCKACPECGSDTRFSELGYYSDDIDE